jgi:microcystin-dependent protein
MSHGYKPTILSRQVIDRPYGSRLRVVLILGVLTLLLSGTSHAQTPFIGEVKVFAGTFAPRGWAECNGQLMQISQHQALFSLIGTIYGGDGRTTFALPDLRSRVVPGRGQGPGLSDYRIGAKGGQEAVTLSVSNLPSHKHPLNATSDLGSSDSPAASFPARAPDGSGQYSPGTNATMPTGTVSNTGGGQGHNNITPHLTLRYIIALEGLFPSRN